MTDLKTYVTTKAAGARVAGRVVPLDDKGAPTAGFELELTAAQASYDLTLGALALKAQPPAQAPVRTSPKSGGADEGEKG